MRRPVLAILAALLVTVLVSSPALAASPTVQKPGSTSSSATLGSTGSVSTDATLSGNPYGCYGQTDYPHQSSTSPGYANVHARTRCSVYVYHVYVYTELYRLRWYGWQYLNNGSSNRYNSYYAQDSVSWYCKGVGTYTYDAESYHLVQQGGVTYTAYTGNSNRFSC